MKKIYGLDRNIEETRLREQRGKWMCSFFHIQGDWFMSKIAIFSHIQAFFSSLSVPDRYILDLRLAHL